VKTTLKERLVKVRDIDTYKRKDQIGLPRVKDGNPNGFLYDWPKGTDIFRFQSEDGNEYIAKVVDDGNYIDLFRVAKEKEK